MFHFPFAPQDRIIAPMTYEWDVAAMTFFHQCIARVPGLMIAGFVAAVASYGGHLAPIVGAPIFAIGIGLCIKTWIGVHEKLTPGVAFASKKVLQAAIILLGSGLSLSSIFETGGQSFIVMIGTLIFALVGGHLIGRWMKLPKKMVNLITVGTSICGASAISSLSPIVGASESEIAYSISTIFLFNVVAVFLFPIIGHLFHFSNNMFGLWAGTAINDTSSVVAAGYAYSHTAGQYATIVKLTRSIMIIPVCLYFLIKTMAQRRNQEDRQSIHFPWFIVGFLGMSGLATIGLFGASGGRSISNVGQFLVVTALVAIGLETDVRGLLRTGYRPLLMGLATWAFVACSSLALQKLTGQ